MARIEDLLPGTLFRLPYDEEDEYNGTFNHNVCIRTMTGYLPFSSMNHMDAVEYPEYMGEEIKVIGILPNYNA